MGLYGQELSVASPFALLPSDAAILGQWITCCLQTPTGSDWTSPEYGLDLRSFLLRAMSTDDLAVLPAQIAAALEFDERIARADVTVTPTFTATGTAKLRLVIVVTPKGAGGKPYTYTGAATADMVSIMLQGSG